MATIFERIDILEKRLTKLEHLLGFSQPEVVHRPKNGRRLVPRRHASPAEGKQARQAIVNYLHHHKTATKRVIFRNVKTNTYGALGWYLQELRRDGKITMVKRGLYKLK